MSSNFLFYVAKLLIPDAVTPSFEIDLVSTDNAMHLSCGVPFHSRAEATPTDPAAPHRLPGWVWLITLVLMGWGAMTPNPVLTPFAVALLPIVAQLLWRHGEPPVMVFAAGMQWLQASTAIFYANFYGMSLEQTFGGPELETATWLSLAGVFVVAVGMRIACFHCHRSEYLRLLADGIAVNLGKAFRAYIVSFGVASVAGAIAFRVPGVTQLIFALITIKWVAVFILAYAVMEQRRGYLLLAFAVLLEFCIGLLGYFASFKSIFFLLLVVILASPAALRGKRLALIGLIAVFLFSLGIVWTAIKGEYREFLNQGTDQQVVLVSPEQQIEKLHELLANFTWRDVQEGLEGLMLRLSYVNFFALTLIHVPDAVPYENGALWFGALRHVVTPRLFFPEKASISDSERTALYTGVQVAGEEQGTSIGIGYIAESYIDFGPVGMFIPILLLGVFYGLIYRAFVIQSRLKLLGTAIATSILIFGAYTIETSNIKLVGGNLTVLIAMSVLYFAFGRSFTNWLTSR